jgi:uncharacterized protein
MVVGRHAELVKLGMRLRVLKDDADNRVLECAVEGHAESIVSGDRHLLDLKEFRGIPIVRVSDFLSKFGGPRYLIPDSHSNITLEVIRHP